MKQGKKRLGFFKSLLFNFFITCKRGKARSFLEKDDTLTSLCDKLKRAIKHKNTPIPKPKQTTIKPDSNKTVLKLLPQ